jgi:hypothetical protein
MEQPDLDLLGEVTCDHLGHQKGYVTGGTQIYVGDRPVMFESGITYVIQVKKHIPRVISDVAHEDRAKSGDHYKILHPDGEPLDPAAKTFVLRLDKEEASHMALRAYGLALRAQGKIAEADALQMKYPIDGSSMDTQYVAGHRLLQLALGIIAGAVTIQRAHTEGIVDDLADLSPEQISEIKVPTGRQSITLEITDIAMQQIYVDAITAVRNPKPKTDSV